jgi:hypothetical protein
MNGELNFNIFTDISSLLLAQVPCDVLSGGEGFLTCFVFLVAFHREKSVDSVGVRLAGMFGCNHFCY